MVLELAISAQEIPNIGAGLQSMNSPNVSQISRSVPKKVARTPNTRIITTIGHDQSRLSVTKVEQNGGRTDTTKLLGNLAAVARLAAGTI